MCLLCPKAIKIFVVQCENNQFIVFSFIQEMIPLKNEKDGKMEIPESDCASKASTEYQELELVSFSC